MKKVRECVAKWVKIVGIVLVVVVCACLVFLFLSYRRVKNSVLGEMGIKNTLKLDSIHFNELDRSAQKELDKKDRGKLLWILSHTKKYDKKEDKRYMLDGYFLPNPYIVFRKKSVSASGHRIYWNYTEATFYYAPPNTSELEQKGATYYLDEKYAQELKELFDKYIDFPIRNY